MRDEHLYRKLIGDFDCLAARVYWRVSYYIPVYGVVQMTRELGVVNLGGASVLAHVPCGYYLTCDLKAAVHHQVMLEAKQFITVLFTWRKGKMWEVDSDGKNTFGKGDSK